jgi:hypothetical protein
VWMEEVQSTSSLSIQLHVETLGMASYNNNKHNLCPHRTYSINPAAPQTFVSLID